MMNTKGLVFDIDRFSTHDGPGIRTALFLKGCPLSCGWCHSPESQAAGAELLYQRARCTGCGACAAACPQKAITQNGAVIEGVAGVRVHRERCAACFACVKACPRGAMRKAGTLFSAEELIASVKPDIPFYNHSGGGVTITGGEPLAQPDFTCELLSRCRDLGIHTVLETSGQSSWETIRAAVGIASAVYFDIKLMNPEQHKQWTGISNNIILRNLENLCRLENAAARITARVPCIPGINDSDAHIGEIAAFVKNLGIQRMELLPYNIMAGEKYQWIDRTYPLEKSGARDKTYYEKLNQIVRAAGLETPPESKPPQHE